MVGTETFNLFSRLGVKTIQTLSEMPVEVLHQLIGKNGTVLWKKAHGIDDTPVVPYSERKSISTEDTFSEDTIDVHQIRSILSGRVEKLAYQLRQEKWLTSTVTVKISGIPTLTQKPNSAKSPILLLIIHYSGQCLNCFIKCIPEECGSV